MEEVNYAETALEYAGRDSAWRARGLSGRIWPGTGGAPMPGR